MFNVNTNASGDLKCRWDDVFKNVERCSVNSCKIYLKTLPLTCLLRKVEGMRLHPY